MPSPETLIASLKLIANRTQSVAAIWHIAVLIALIGLVSGWRPSRRTIALALSLPLFSVGAVGWHHLNVPFGAVFTVLSIVLALLARRASAESRWRSCDVPPRWALALGVATTGYGLCYPHYLDGHFFWYLYAAPMGVLPCPTLAFAIGVALIVDDMGSRAWPLLLAGAGLCFGLLGLVALGVWLELGLILGAAGLLVRALSRRSPLVERG